MKIFLALIGFYCSNVFGQWEDLKIPRKALVNDIIYAGNRICIGSSEGIFMNRYEEDTQFSWDELSAGFTDPDIQALCSTNSMLIAATKREIHIASLHDLVWHHTKNAIDADRINEFALDYHLNIYAATSNGLWYSEDHGLHWKQLALNNIPLLSVLVMPDQTSYVVGSDEIHYGAIYTGYLKDPNPKLIQTSYHSVLKLFPSFRKEEVLVGSLSQNPNQFNVNLLSGWDQPKQQSLGLQNAAVSSFEFGKNLSLVAGIRALGSWAGTVGHKGVYFCPSISSPNVQNQWFEINEGMSDASVECMFRTADYLFIGTEQRVYRRNLENITTHISLQESVPKIIYHENSNQLELHEELVGKLLQLFTSDGKLVCSFSKTRSLIQLPLILQPGLYYCAISLPERNYSVSVLIH